MQNKLFYMHKKKKEEKKKKEHYYLGLKLISNL